MMTHFAILFCGFSIFSIIILLFSYFFFLENLQKSNISKIFCTSLLSGLIGLQIFHYLFLINGYDALSNRIYLLLLLSIPACFYFFSRYVLFPDSKLINWEVLHFLPIILGTLLPKPLIPAIAFLIGTGYTFWFSLIVFRLRSQHRRFHLEMFFFGLFAVLATIALMLGLSIPYIDSTIFYIAYANAIGLTVMLIIMALIIFPDLISDIKTIADNAYSQSKLSSIDVSEKAKELETLIQQDNIYQNEKLNLSLVAEILELTPHQLSELINTHYGIGFSRFVREQRVAQAKKLLIDEPSSSILAISIMTGFQSQSNFYAAFREIAGESPGGYRKRLLQT